MLLIRPARVDDTHTLWTLIREFAEYERELDLVVISEADLRRDGFGPDPRFRALIAEWDGQIAGYAVFFEIYSTWEGRAALLLEDLFVREEFRGKGIGTALLKQVARLAQDEGCFGLRWEVRDWNEAAVELYKAMGGKFLSDRCSVLLVGAAFERLAGETS